MWLKLIVTFAILYLLIMLMAALKPSKEQLVDYYNAKDAICKEHGEYFVRTHRYYVICGDETELKN